MVFLLLRLAVFEGLHEALKLGSGHFGLPLVGLAFLDVLDGLFDLSSRSAYDFGGFFAGFVEYLLAPAANVFEFALVFFGQILEVALGGLDLAYLLVEHTAVARDPPEVLLDPDELFAGAVFGVFDDGFGELHLAGKLEGE